MRKVVMILAVFFITSGVLYAQEYEEGREQEYEKGRTYLGIMLDMEPLPEILTKHLDLEPGQGVRIQNVANGSPADQAGLEQDDIVIRFGDMEIRHGQELVEAVRNSEIEQRSTMT